MKYPKVKLFVDGEEVSPDEWAAKQVKKLKTHIFSTLAHRLHAIECPEHHMRPILEIYHANPNQLSMRVRDICCDAQKARCDAELARDQPDSPSR